MNSVTAQLSLYEKHVLAKDGDTLPYRVLLPKNYDAAKAYPLVLFLHGSGERGNDNEAQLAHGGDLFVNDSVRSNNPAIVVFPQCPVSSYWSNVKMVFDSTTNKRQLVFLEDGEPTTAMRMLLSLLGELHEQYKVDTKRRYVSGLSMGGMGTFELVRRKPKYFAAAIAICGGAHPGTANKLRHVKWWLFHGAKDDIVSPQFSQAMADALKSSGADVRFTLYPEANHNSWDSAFAEKGLLPWLFSQHR